MKGSSQKQKSHNKPARLNRSRFPAPASIPVPIQEPARDLGGRPTGSIGLRKQLIQEHCGPNPTTTQLLLVDALMKLYEVRKKDLSPRDLFSSLSSERGIIKLLHEMKNGRGGYDNNPANNSFAGMDEEQIDEHRHLCSHLVWSPHEHLKDGTINYYAPDALIHVHKDDQIDYHPKRITRNEAGEIVPFMEN